MDGPVDRRTSQTARLSRSDIGRMLALVGGGILVASGFWLWVVGSSRQTSPRLSPVVPLGTTLPMSLTDLGTHQPVGKPVGVTPSPQKAETLRLGQQRPAVAPPSSAWPAADSSQP